MRRHRSLEHSSRDRREALARVESLAEFLISNH